MTGSWAGLSFILAPNFYAETAARFLAFVGGEAAGVVELCSASTRPALRRQGVQAALIQARLQAAGREGDDLAMIVASVGSISQRNAERAGFRLAYTKAILDAA